MKNLILAILILTFSFTAYSQSPYWSKINSGTTTRLISVSFGSPLMGYISGEDSLLLKTTDGGKTWIPVSHSGLSFSLAASDIIHINFVNATAGFAIVSNFENPYYSGVMFKTTDGGMTWTPVVSGTIAAYSSFFYDKQNGYQVGSAFFSGQTLIKMTNSTWSNYQTFSYNPQDFLYTVDFYDSNVGIAGGTGGLVYRTFNGGATWDTVKTVIDSAIHSLKFVDHRTILGASDNSGGAIIISTDTGRTWQIDMNTLTFAYPMLKGLVLSKKDSFVAVGKASFNSQGVILSWSNGFANLASVSQPMNCVCMRDDSIAFAVGDSGLIMSNLNTQLSVQNVVDKESFVCIAPNPSDGSFNIKMLIPYTVTILDMNGRLVYQNDKPAIDQNIVMKASAKGIYTVILHLEHRERIVRKVVIH